MTKSGPRVSTTSDPFFQRYICSGKAKRKNCERGIAWCASKLCLNCEAHSGPTPRLPFTSTIRSSLFSAEKTEMSAALFIRTDCSIIGNALPSKTPYHSFINLARDANVVEVVFANQIQLARLIQIEDFAALNF